MDEGKQKVKGEAAPSDQDTQVKIVAFDFPPLNSQTIQILNKIA